jgi:hypothetical protein
VRKLLADYELIPRDEREKINENSKLLALKRGIEGEFV